MGRKKDILAKLLCAVMAVSLIAGLMPREVAAADIPKYHNIPAYQYKDIFETERVNIQGIKVEEIIDDSVDPVETQPLEKSIEFTIFNSTKQEVERTVVSQNGVLPELNLIKNHNYIIFAEDYNDTGYWMRNAYIWVKDGKLVNIKHDPDLSPYPEFNSLQLYNCVKKEPIAEAERRITTNISVYKGEGLMYNKKFKLVSDIETLEVTSGNNGRLSVINQDNLRLLEDITYMVVLEDDTYGVEPFPLAGKDKSEYKYQNNKELGRYFYDHSSCKKVENIQLIDKKDVHKNDKPVTSDSGNTTISGFNFKDFLIMDRKLDKNTISGLEDKECDVVDIKVVNPHRWEISKLAAGEFKITEKIDAKRIVSNVYYVDANNDLQPLEFEQVDNTVNFTMNSLSLYPVVIEYNLVKEGLNAAIEEAGKLEEADYTVNSWESYSGIIENAKGVAENKAATNEECQAQIDAIAAAKEALVISESITPARKAAMEAVVKEAEGLNAAAYTAESWKVYSDAVETVKSLLAEENAANAECKAALQKIAEAKAALKAVPKKVNVTKVTVSGLSKKIAAGKKVQLTAGIVPSNATNKAVTWTTSNKKYATVSSTGKVTTKKAGGGKTVSITATAQDGSGVKAVYKIKIMKNAVKSIKLKAAKTVKAGKKVTVKATVKTTGKSANKKLKWTSSNKKYATVTSKGKVNTKKAGKGKNVKITAKATDGSGKKKTVKIKIK